MLKIRSSPLNEGTHIRLPEQWHDKILAFSQKETCSYDFTIEEIVKDKDKKETYCICKSEKCDEVIVLTDDVVKYLLAEEVEDSNIGLVFKEYLPLEESRILITNTRNPSEVVPAIFRVSPKLVNVNKTSYVAMSFEVDYMNGNGFTTLSYYSYGTRKFTWKFISGTDQAYMTDYEKMFCDTIIHRGYVEKSCKKLIAYLEREGATEHARLLSERMKVHDMSKMSNEDEMRALSMIINDKTSLADASKQLSQIKQDAIKLHWKHNTHHPEHFKTPIDMSKLDIMEMCCDWHARSTQYKTNFLEFVQKRQEDRFHFPEWMFAEIWHYCEVLNAP